jgi:hypothetical protein
MKNFQKLVWEITPPHLLPYEFKLKLARNPTTSPKTLVNLSQDKSWIVLCWVAYNRNTPLEVLKILATDKITCVRYNVAYNPNATEEICLMIKAYEKYGHLVNCHTSST